MLPSDYVHRNVFAGFHEDAMGIRDRHIIGVDNLLWGSDYLHVESTFPRSRQIIEEILADCTEEEKLRSPEAMLSGYTVSPRFLRLYSGRLTRLPVGTPGEEYPPL